MEEPNKGQKEEPKKGPRKRLRVEQTFRDSGSSHACAAIWALVENEYPHSKAHAWDVVIPCPKPKANQCHLHQVHKLLFPTNVWKAKNVITFAVPPLTQWAPHSER